MNTVVRMKRCLCRGFSLLVSLLLATAMGIPASAEGEDTPGLPCWLTEESREPGQVEIVEYVNCYGMKLRAGVYLPYGYSEDEVYDVAIVWGGTRNDYDEIFNYCYPCLFEDGQTCSLSTVQMLDRMIEQKEIRPVIVVAMTDIGSTNTSHADRDIGIMLDYVKENYSTYASAEGISREELREHFSLWGFSQGAMFAQSAGMGLHFEDFASFAAVSYGDEWSVVQGVTESPYELRLLYACAGGSRDHGADSTRRNYDAIVKGCGDKIVDGENALLRIFPAYGHSYSLLLTAMYEFLPRMFPAEKEAAPWVELMELYYSGYRPRRRS